MPGYWPKSGRRAWGAQEALARGLTDASHELLDTMRAIAEQKALRGGNVIRAHIIISGTETEEDIFDVIRIATLAGVRGSRGPAKIRV